MKRLSTYKTMVTQVEPDQLFLGGTLELRIIDGEKIVDGRGENIFGTGMFESSVEVMCGSQLLARSVVKNAMLECRVGERRWDGFDSFLKPMVITPHMPAVIHIKVYECNRETRDEVLGEAPLNLVDILPDRSNSEVLPVVKADQVFISGMSDTVGKVHVRTVFTPFETTVIGPEATVEIPENVAQNKGKFSIGVGYNTVLQDRISISLVMFNKEGQYIDAVSLNKRHSTHTKAIPACYEEVIPHVGYLQDKHEISFDLNSGKTSGRSGRGGGSAPDSSNVKALILVLSDYTEFGSLENLKDVYVRIKEYKGMTELYRYKGFVIDRPATSGMLLRMVRDDSDPKVWYARTYDNVWAFEAREHGFMIPRLKTLLRDVIPDCMESNSDRMATLDVEESLCISEYCAAGLLPAELSIGLDWETISPRAKMRVDLGCVLLTAQWEQVDSVTATQEQTSCGSVKHGGEEQGDRGGDKSDQMIHISLATVPESVCYICCYLTSTSPDADDTLRNGSLCAGKFLDKATERVLSVFTLRDKQQMDSFPALHVCFLFKLDDKWYFQVAGGAGAGAPGVTPEQIVGHAKKYLMDKRATLRRMQINTNNAKLIKRHELNSRQSSKHTTPAATPRMQKNITPR